MPRPTIALAGLIIAGCALAGVALGLMRDLKSRSGVDPNGEVVASIKTVANATPLTSPPVTEADVRRWVHEELAASRPAPSATPKKPRSEASPDGDTAAPPPPPVVGATPAQPAAPATAPKNQTSAQIPF